MSPFPKQVTVQWQKQQQWLALVTVTVAVAVVVGMGCQAICLLQTDCPCTRLRIEQPGFLLDWSAESCLWAGRREIGPV